MKRILCCLLLLASILSVRGYESPGIGPDINLSPGARPWKLWTRAFVGYDDNVQEIGRATFFRGDSASGFTGVTVVGTYQLLDVNDWMAGVALRFDQLLYFDDAQSPAPAGTFTIDARDYNYTIFNPAVYVARRLNAGSAVPLTARVVYDYRSESAQVLGGQYQTLSVGLGAQLSEAWSADILYAHGWDDYHVLYPPFLPSQNMERDGQRDSLTLSLSYLFNQKRTRATLAYSLLRNDSDGQNWAYTGQAVSLQVKTLLSGPFALSVQLGYANRDYIAFIAPSPLTPPPGRTDLDIYSAGVQLLYKIGPQWTADVFYNYSSIQSNIALFDSNRSIFGMGLRYDF